MTVYGEEEVNVFVDTLEESSEEVKTTRIRQELTIKGVKKSEEEINQMFAALEHEGYVDLTDYNSAGYHSWKKSPRFDYDDCIDLLNGNSDLGEFIIQAQFGDIHIKPKSQID